MAGHGRRHLIPGLEEPVIVPVNLERNETNIRVAGNLEYARLLILLIEDYRRDREVFNLMKEKSTKEQISIVHEKFTSITEDIAEIMTECRAIQQAEEGVMPTPAAISGWLALNMLN